MGVGLQDPFTFYHGIRDTAYMTACTLYDDSLATAGLATGIFGNYSDATFGSVEAVLYSQVTTPTDGVRITDEVQIDSVVMTLVVDTIFPVRTDSTPVPLHIIINQLAEELRSDSLYISNQQMLESDVCFFDSVVNFAGDSLRLHLRPSIYSALRGSFSQADFLSTFKGISIRLAPSSQRMVSVSFAATNTRLTLYYHNPTIDDEPRQFEFIINGEAAHSMYYSHDYSGTPLAQFGYNTKDTLEGSQRLYLEPLGGTRVRLNLQPFLNNFREKHPYAIIHYAELLLPVADTSDAQPPVRIIAMKRGADGNLAYVTDANVVSNPYTYAGFDGYYNREKHYYRLRVSRHLQELMRTGIDNGTELIIDGRRSTAFRTVLNGTETASPVRIDFVYTE